MAGASLGAYGKLPCAREFVRAGSRAADVEAAVDMAARFWMRATRSGPAADLWVTHTPALARAVMIWPSADAHRERPHPFAAWAVLDRTDSLSQTLRAALALRADLDHVRSCLGNGDPPPAHAEAVTVALPPLPLAPWIEATFEHGVDSLVLALWQLDQLARGCASPRGVRLPLAPDLDPFVQADAWLALLPPSPGLFPHAVVPAPDKTRASMTLLAPFDPRDFVDLLSPAHGEVLDLSADCEPTRVAGFSTFAKEWQRQIAAADCVAELRPPIGRSG